MFKYKIFFKIEYKTAFEEFLVIVGNTNDLGNWNVEKGLKLKWSKVNFFF